jgi:hypothetical protein
MASILDLIRSATGQPDINQQLAAAVGQAPGQPGSSQGPQPLAGASPGGGADAGPPTAGAPPAGAPPQPQAYTSSPDMTQLYLKFAQQQHADDMFNRGLAGVAAGFAPSWDRSAILGMGRDTTQDPGALFGNIMKLQGWQQQQQQYKAWLDSVPDQANQLGMTQQEVMALGPDSTKTALALKIPPEQLRNYNAFKQQYVSDHAGDKGPDGNPIGPGAAAQQFEQLNPMSVMMAGATGGSIDPNDQRRQIELGRWLADPANKGKQPPDYFRDVPNFLAHGQLVQQQSADRGQAIQKFGDLNAGLNNYVTTLSGISNDPNLDKLTGSVKNEGMVTAHTPALLGTANYALHNRIVGLQKLSTDLQGKAAPGTQGALSGLQSGAPDLTTYSTPPDDYRQNVVAPLMRQALTAQANAYGASGQTDKMPPYLRAYLDPVYAPGGELYVGSGAWKASKADPTKKPLTPAIAKTQIEEYGPSKGIQVLKNGGYDTSSLE